MAQADFLEIFEDCVGRINRGQTVHDCLSIYPELAGQLRPLLETVASVRSARIPTREIIEDQQLVWQVLKPSVSNKPANSTTHVINLKLQLFVAILVLILLSVTMWFFLSRPDINREDVVVPIVETITSVPTNTITPLPTHVPELHTPTIQLLIVSPTAFVTKTSTTDATSTHTQTATPTLIAREPEDPLPTDTPIPREPEDPSPTDTPIIATYSECGSLLSRSDVIERVLEIYPNTTIIDIEEVRGQEGRMLWEVETSHRIQLTIDAACGYILTIVRDDTGGDEPTATFAAPIDDRPMFESGSGFDTDSGTNQAGDSSNDVRNEPEDDLDRDDREDDSEDGNDDDEDDEDDGDDNESESEPEDDSDDD